VGVSRPSGGAGTSRPSVIIPGQPTGGGGSGGISSPMSLTISNAGSQAGSHWTDSGGVLTATWAAATSGVVSVNNTSWGDAVIWDLSDLFGVDITAGNSPILALDWVTDTGPSEAAVVGFGFCVAANLAGASIGTKSRWANLYSNGSGSEGINAKRNVSTGQTSTLKTSPGLCRLTPILQSDEWTYHACTLTHGSGGNDPHFSSQTPRDPLTGSNKVYAWLSGGPASAAVGEVVYKGTLQVFYGGDRS